ncbi:unnamed protein product [Urochloa humidicola]
MIALRAKGKGSPCSQDDDSQRGERQIYSGPSLPEDILCHIHSLMSMRDAAQAACVSRAFLHSWRSHPNLNFSNTALGLNKRAYQNDEIARDFSSKVDHILRKHTGIGVKKLKIHMSEFCNTKDSCYLNSWLEISVIPGIEELAVTLPRNAKYNFPYSLLSNGGGDSIRYLHLACCSFHPTSELGWLRTLTRLHLCFVCIKGGELAPLLSSSLALEQLEIMYCDGIVCLKVSCMLQHLSYLKVFECSGLRVIDSKAPNISSFSFAGHRVKLSLGETLQMKNLYMSFSGAVHYTRVELPSSMPNLEIATIYSRSEIADTPMLHSKYAHLKNRSILLTAVTFPPTYDYFSLASFFDACPSLEIFLLDVSQWKMEHVSIFGDPSDLRQMRGQHHHKIKCVEILGFTSSKSLVELTCHVVENMPSLERLTLEAHQSSFRCSVPGDNCSKCSELPIDVLMEAQRALFAIRVYIEPKVPSTVKLDVVEPCRQCHGELTFLG